MFICISEFIIFISYIWIIHCLFCTVNDHLQSHIRSHCDGAASPWLWFTVFCRLKVIGPGTAGWVRPLLVTVRHNVITFTHCCWVRTTAWITCGTTEPQWVTSNSVWWLQTVCWGQRATSTLKSFKNDLNQIKMWIYLTCLSIINQSTYNQSINNLCIISLSSVRLHTFI